MSTAAEIKRRVAEALTGEGSFLARVTGKPVEDVKARYVRAWRRRRRIKKEEQPK